MRVVAKRLTEGASLLGIAVDEQAVSDLVVYFEELRKWSRKINLVAKSVSDEELIEKHFLDSLALLACLDDGGAHLLDIGTGAGFPGLVCKVARRQMMTTLVEPRQKRVSFLKHVARTLKLDKTDILCCRIEDEQAVPVSAGFTHITCRAVTDVSQLLQMVERFSAAGPELLFMKGPRWQEEMAEAGGILQRSSYNLKQQFTWELPFSGAQRTLLVFSVH